MRDLQGLLARLFDVLMIVGGAAVASQIRFEYIEAHTYSVAFVAFAAAFSLALFPGFGVYQSWRGRSKLQLACQVSLGWLVVQGCALALMFSLHRLDYVSRLWFAYWTAMSGGLMIAGRLITHAILAHMRNAGLNLQQVAIVGCGRHCDSMLRKIERSQDTGFRMCAAFNAAAGKSRLNTRLPVYDDFDAFVAFVRAQNVHEVWLALPLSEEPTILRFVNEFRDDLINVRFIPDVRSLALFESGVTDLLGQPAINLVATPLSASAQLQRKSSTACSRSARSSRSRRRSSASRSQSSSLRAGRCCSGRTAKARMAASSPSTSSVRCACTRNRPECFARPRATIRA